MISKVGAFVKTVLANLAQILISRQRRLLTIAMLPTLGVPARWNVNVGFRSLNRYRFININIVAVITAIGRHAGNWLPNSCLSLKALGRILNYRPTLGLKSLKFRVDAPPLGLCEQQPVVDR